MEETTNPEVSPEAPAEAVTTEEAPAAIETELELAPNDEIVVEEPAPAEEVVAEEPKVVKKSKKVVEETPAEEPVVAAQAAPVANPARVSSLNGMQISIK